MSTIEVHEAVAHAPQTAVEAGARVHPPFSFAGTLLAGLLLQRLFPFSLFSRRPARVVGALLTIAGLSLGAASARAMRNAGTPVRPNLPSSTVVTTGPYQFSRNPIYLSMALMYAGISGLANAAWPLLMLPSLLYAITVGMIQREEEYLEQRFGDRYREYRERVRRWI